MQRPPFNRDYIIKELDKLSLTITSPLKLFVIGGMALIDFGLKEGTKDLDVVVQDPSELNTLVVSLESLGYSSPDLVKILNPYKKMETSKILENTDGFRWDIFLQQICRALIFSKGMVSRSTSFYNKKLLKVMQASKEDIFLFKGITEREADLDDMRLLAESGIDWKVVERECRIQSVSSGRLWENALLSNLIDLRHKHEIRSPIERTIQKIVEEKLTEDALIDAVKRGVNTVKMISKETKLPEYLVRDSAKKMVEKGLLGIDRSSLPHKLFLTKHSRS